MDQDRLVDEAGVTWIFLHCVSPIWHPLLCYTLSRRAPLGGASYHYVYLLLFFGTVVVL